MRLPLVAVLLLTAVFASAADTLPKVRLLTPSVRQYEKVEFALTPDSAPANPFDPTQAALDAVITTPSGKRVTVPGFWFQDYARSIRNPEATGLDRIEVLESRGTPEWRVRFSSGETGAHRIVLALAEGGKIRRSEPLAFEVAPGPRPGFIRVSPRNRSYLEDGAGRVFFPIGENLCMYQRREGTYYFDRLLARLVAAGGNYVRIWQEYYVPRDKDVSGPGDGDFTGFPLETQLTGLGRYDLEPAWRLDYVSELCERLDVHWQLTFEMVVWWERKLHRWKHNPYNAENGGPCVNPEDYLTNAKARELVKRRLRYSVARWGWTAHLAAWELWNEIDNMDNFTSEASASWHREMGAYLRKIDPSGRLITTSWRDRATFALPEIDIVQGHSYWEPQFDAAEYSLQDTEHLMRGFGKPFFFGEQGIEGPVSVDPEGKHFHDCAWATALSGAAGTGMYWWWHNYVEPYNLYRHYTPLARFVKDEDFAARQWKRPVPARPNLPVTLRVYGLVAEDRALLWIHDPLAFRIQDGKAQRGPDQSGASLNVAGLPDGDYRIDWWDTSTGEVIRTDRADVRHLRHFGYGLELAPPDFWGDIAAKIEKLRK